MAKKSPLEGESLMLILHPVFLIATIAHLIGYGATRIWRAMTGARDPQSGEPDTEPDRSRADPERRTPGEHGRTDLTAD